MTSHHVICHVTAVTCLFIVKKKININIKSRKIDKRKRKILVLTHIITWQLLCNYVQADRINTIEKRKRKGIEKKQTRKKEKEKKKK